MKATMKARSRRTLTQRLSAAALGAALLGGVPAAADAADLAPLPGRHIRHVRISHAYANWRDRCAYAGYYCLYAEYGFVYAYPFDDRPIARARYRRYVR